MSALGGKADMTVCGCLLFRSLLGVKRTSSVAPHMSASDPKRTSVGSRATPSRVFAQIATITSLSLGGEHEAARVHQFARRYDRDSAGCTRAGSRKGLSNRFLRSRPT